MFPDGKCLRQLLDKGMLVSDGSVRIAFPTHVPDTPGRQSAGIWKHSDFTPPVGMMTKASSPLTRLSIISCCGCLKES